MAAVGLLAAGCGSDDGKVDWEAKACDSRSFFDPLREFADLMGQPFDAKDAVEGLVQIMRDGGKQLRGEMEAAGADITEIGPEEENLELPSWYDLSDAERQDFRRGALAAAEGRCG